MTLATYQASAPGAAQSQARPRIPALEKLKATPQWVLWRCETRGQEQTKVPFDALHARSERKASSTNERTWSTFSEAARALNMYRQEYGYRGLGFVFSVAAGITGIDVDNCLDERGALRAWARPFVEPLLAIGAYGEVSPSGRGLKFFVYGLVPDARYQGKSVAIYDDEGRKVGKVEVYSQQRFFTVTGRRYAGAGDDLVAGQEQIAALYHQLQELRAARGGSTRTTTRTPAPIDAALLASIDARVHIGPDGIPLGLSAQSQTRRLLGDALARAAFAKPEGDGPDWSVLRWIVTKGLYSVGYAPEDILALARYYHQVLNGSKTSAEFDTDILCCIQHWREQYPHIRVHPAVIARRLRVVDEPAPAPPPEPAPARQSRARKDRPQRVAGAAAYLQWLRERADGHTGAVMLSLSEVAEELHISRRSVIRYEHELKAAGLVERRPYAARQRGVIFILDTFGRGDNISEVAPDAAADTVVTARAAERVATRQNEDGATQKEHAFLDTTAEALDEPRATPATLRNEPATSLESGQVEPGARVPSPPAPDVPPAMPAPETRRQVLDRLVIEALEQCAARERLDEATGEIAAGRASWRQVLEYVNERASFPEAAIRRCYDYWLRRRRWLRQIAKLRRDAPHLSGRKLHGLARWCDKILSGPPEEPQRAIAALYYDIVEGELERRRQLRSALAARPNSRRARGQACQAPLFAPEAPAPGSQGFSLDCVKRGSAPARWRLWDDARDVVISEHSTEAEALAELARLEAAPLTLRVAWLSCRQAIAA